MVPSSDALVVSSRSDRVLTLQMNRPDRMNAVSLDLYRDLEASLRKARNDSDIRAVVLTGSGRAFCVGADLEAHARGTGGESARREYVEAAQSVNRLLRTIPKVTIGAANGHAIGAGFELLLSCDLAVVAADAKYRLPELALGTFVGGGVTHDLVRRAGRSAANEILFLAEMLDGSQVRELGLANEAVPSGEVAQAAMEMANRAASLAPLSVARAKEVLSREGDLTLDELLAAEAEALLECMATEDWAEGIAAFNEKRPPEFEGR